MSELTERAEKLAHLMDVSVIYGIPSKLDDPGPRLAARDIAATLRALVEELATLRADLARVTEEASQHRSIVASLWDYLRSRDAVPPREGSDHDRIMLGLGTLELRVTAALAAEREGANNA